jgi:hypothetical protein
MELTYRCPGCGAVARVSPAESCPGADCGACGRRVELRGASFDETGLRACPLCATEDLYVQKDFPQTLGLVIVAAGFLASTVFWYYDWPVAALSILLASALADMALFYLVPDVTICYRCLSQVRGGGSNPSGRLRGFDLAVGERYRQERLRAEELRGRASPAEPTPPL